MTLEAIWRKDGRRIRRTARKSLRADRQLVEAVCLEVMKRAAVALSDGPAGDERDPWPLLRAVTQAVCVEVQSGVEFAAPTKPMPEAIPFSYRAHFHLRAVRARQEAALCAELGVSPNGTPAEREAAIRQALSERRRGGLRAVWLAPVLHRYRARLGERTRALGRRLETMLDPTGVLDAGQHLTAAVAAGGSQAAAVVAAVVAIGMGPAPATDPVDDLALGELAAATQVAADSTDAPVPTRSTTRVSPAGPTPVTAPVVDPPAEEPVAPSEPTIRPQVTAETNGAIEEPVRTRSEADQTSIETAEPSATVDPGDDDSPEDDTSVTLPSVGGDCPPPEERGAVTGAVCPVVEGASL